MSSNLEFHSFLGKQIFFKLKRILKLLQIRKWLSNDCNHMGKVWCYLPEGYSTRFLSSSSDL